MSISTQALEYLYRPEFLEPFIRAGFNLYDPAWDTGVDFLLVKEFPPDERQQDLVIKVQMKSRWTINAKYIGKNIWIAFPERPLEADVSLGQSGNQRNWYLMPHDLMVRQALAEHGSSQSFKEGHYSKSSVPKAFIASNSQYLSLNLLAHIATHKSVSTLLVDGYSTWPTRDAQDASWGEATLKAHRQGYLSTEDSDTLIELTRKR